jgi:hypothetical protein
MYAGMQPLNSLQQMRVYNEAMRITWRAAAAVIISVLSIVLLVWGLWPAGHERRILSLAPSNTALPTQPPPSIPTVVPPGGTIAAPTERISEVLERRRISLEYPAKIRSRDSDIIRLTLEVAEPDGLTPTTVSGDIESTGDTIEIPNLYETHDIIAEARLDMAGVEFRPYEQISSPLGPGLPVTFYWSVQPLEIGKFRGTVWLFLKFVNKGTGEQSRRAVSAQVIEIQSSTLFGLPGNIARTAGTIGSVAGSILGFPFLEKILKYLFKRRHKV